MLPLKGRAFYRRTIPEGQHYDYQVDATMVAPFISLDWMLSDRVTVTGGLRFEFNALRLR